MRIPFHPLSSATLAATLLLTGCSLTPTAKPTVADGLALRGNVHGGQQPIAGAHIYVMAAGTSGYGGASTSLMTTGVAGTDSIGGYVLTDANGGFTYGASEYTCTPGTQVYLLALGGDPGAGVNSAAGLMAILGNCPVAGNFDSAVPFIWINEVSTVAAAYAMAGFATDATHVSSSGTALARTGIANAFANATNLAGISTGAALSTTPAGNGTVPRTTLNTLANILASCVNTNGPGSPSCTTLFSNATSDGTVSGTAPTETATAAINMAHHPAANVAALFGIPAPVAAFAPALSTQPNDFTLSLTFTGGGINGTNNLAIDADGSVWISNYSNALAKLSPLGAPISPSGGYTDSSLNGPYGLAIDSAGNVWTVNSSGSGGTLTEFSAGGQFLRTATYPHFAYDLAIDPTGNLWVPNYSSTSNANVAKLSSTGMAINTLTTGGLDQPLGVAIDGTGSVWVGNANASTVTKYLSNGTADPSSPFSIGSTAAISLAIDSNGDVWTLNQDSSLTAITSAGATLSGSPYNTGVNQSPKGIAIDGQDNVFVVTSTFNWMTFTATSSLTSLSGAGVLQGTFTAPDNAQNVSVDGSGDLWMTDSTEVVEMIGVAAPVVTPVSAAVAANTIATRP